MGVDPRGLSTLSLISLMIWTLHGAADPVGVTEDQTSAPPLAAACKVARHTGLWV